MPDPSVIDAATRRRPGISAGGLPPLLLRTADAAAICGVAERTWRSWHATGKVPMPVRIGRTPLWAYAELQRWAAAGCPDRLSWQVLRN